MYWYRRMKDKYCNSFFQCEKSCLLGIPLSYPLSTSARSAACVHRHRRFARRYRDHWIKPWHLFASSPNGRFLALRHCKYTVVTNSLLHQHGRLRRKGPKTGSGWSSCPNACYFRAIRAKIPFRRIPTTRILVFLTNRYFVVLWLLSVISFLLTWMFIESHSLLEPRNKFVVWPLKNKVSAETSFKRVIPLSFSWRLIFCYLQFSTRSNLPKTFRRLRLRWKWFPQPS